ncbi:hypothetical protein Tco_1233328 [Tanacetum coccineum]
MEVLIITRGRAQDLCSKHIRCSSPKPDHKTWTVPLTKDYMDKVLTCQTCECVINEMYGAVICDACESACGNVAAILELDAYLNQRFRVSEAAPHESRGASAKKPALK